MSDRHNAKRYFREKMRMEFVERIMELMSARGIDVPELSALTNINEGRLRTIIEHDIRSASLVEISDIFFELGHTPLISVRSLSKSDLTQGANWGR